ncbi:MAG: LuxR C-terminal-related transcriptional regulator [Eggerthellaceae bacterium]|nr:LuxR C-terminal-related transcriptional regulator [Eggerthellaceae bacterium]
MNSQKTTNAIWAHMKSLSMDWSSIESRWQIAFSLALVLLSPWIIFLSNVVIYYEDLPSTSILLFIAFLILAICTESFVFLFPPYAKRKKAYYSSGANIVGSLSSAAGICLLGFGSIFTFWLGLAGAFLCALGYALLCSVWIAPLCRKRLSDVTLLSSVALIMAIIIYLVLSVMAYPFGCIIIMVLYAVVPPIALRQTDKRLLTTNEMAESIHHPDIFVSQSHYKMYTLMGLCIYSFGYCIMMLSGSGINFDGYNAITWLIPIATVIVLWAMLYYSTSKRHSVLLGLITISFLCLSIGVALLSYQGLFLVGSTVVLVGFIIFNVFYLVYYSSICQTKGFSDARSRSILGKTLLIFPIAILLAAATFLLINAFAPGAIQLITAILQVALIIVLFSVFYTELSLVRRDLALKTDSIIDLNDILKFADEKSEYKLTKRECQIIHLIMGGRSVAAVSRELYLSESTIKTHIRAIYKKLDVHNRQEMIDKVSREIN